MTFFPISHLSNNFFGGMTLKTKNTIPYFHVDAFTNRIFSGNPAGVCPLENWLDDAALQSIASENNLSETAFFVRKEDIFELRWFAPKAEVDLCGHATLASAFVIFNLLGFSSDVVSFSTRSGLLSVKKKNGLLEMHFPARPGKQISAPDALAKGLGKNVTDIYKSRDYLVILNSEDEVRNMKPDFQELSNLDCTGVIITAKGKEVDFVSRFFAPRVGIPEDPVTGSSHCTLIPYWAEKLGKKELTAHQVSWRGGELFCEHLGDRVSIAGNAVLYLKGSITL
jgi:PhzF family phenazine biosynthesis protein